MGQKHSRADKDKEKDLAVVSDHTSTSQDHQSAQSTAVGSNAAPNELVAASIKPSLDDNDVEGGESQNSPPLKQPI